MQFPFRQISEEQRDKSFNELRSITIPQLKLTNKYNLCSDYYFQLYRLSTKKGKWSNISAWNDKEERRKILETDRRVNGDKSGTPQSIRRTIRLWYGCVGQFRPDVAVYVYKKFNCKTVLDFSAGWGDRLIAALSQKINYIGIDSNHKLINPYKQMLYKFGKESKVMMIFNRSENINFDKLPEYDLIFTSPPYFTIELYQNMRNYTKTNS